MSADVAIHCSCHDVPDGMQVLLTDEAELPTEQLQLVEVPRNAPAYIIFTSGSTGSSQIHM
jgi:acyl-coenzyme A synthetase/AMP-(fatty) acid ligase